MTLLGRVGPSQEQKCGLQSLNYLLFGSLKAKFASLRSRPGERESNLSATAGQYFVFLNTCVATRLPWGLSRNCSAVAMQLTSNHPNNKSVGLKEALFKLGPGETGLLMES